MGYLVRPCPKDWAQSGLNASTYLVSRETSHTLLNSASEYLREVGEEARSRRQDGRKALERVGSFGQVTMSHRPQFLLQCEGLTTAAIPSLESPRVLNTSERSTYSCAEHPVSPRWDCTR